MTIDENYSLFCLSVKSNVRMRNIKLNETPNNYLYLKNRILEVLLRYILENSVDFYKFLKDWVKQYDTSPQNKTVFNIKVEYFNTLFSGYPINIFKCRKSINKEKDEGDTKNFKSITSLPFKMINLK